MAGVVNVEVPVRVFDGDRFVDNLTINDFEVYENGVLQKVEAVYLVKKSALQRKEESRAFKPQTSRAFYLFFEIFEDLPKLYDAVDYFVNNVLGPEDNLVVVTALKTYQLKREAMERLPKEKIIAQLGGIIRRDTAAGNMEYRSTIEDLKGIARELTSRIMGDTMGANRTPDPATGISMVTGAELPLDQLLEVYRSVHQRLENLRSVDEKRLLDFAKHMKAQEGQKHVFMFYEREFLPMLDRKILLLAGDEYKDRPDIQMTISSLFSPQIKELTANTDLIKRAYADASISLHLLFITTLPENIAGITFQEHSDDIFSPLLEMAKATGGVAESSANPAFMVQKAAEASENYYILYYAPKDYKADSKFKEIKVRVKGKDFQVSNRAGYFAN